MMLKRIKIEREWLFAAFTAHLEKISAEYLFFSCCLFKLRANIGKKIRERLSSR